MLPRLKELFDKEIKSNLKGEIALTHFFYC